MPEVCPTPNIDLNITTDLTNSPPAVVCQHTKKEIKELLGGWLPNQWPETPPLIDSTSPLPEYLEITNLCENPGTICWLEQNPDDPSIKTLSLKFETPKNFDWIMASLKATLLPLKVEFNSFDLQQNFTNPVVAPSFTLQDNWNQRIKTSAFTRLKFDVIVENNVDMIVLKVNKDTTVTIPLNQFINDIIDHPCIEQNLQEPICQSELQRISSLYPTSSFDFAYGFSPDQLPTDNQTTKAVITANESGEFIEVNDQVRFDIKDEAGNIIGEVIISPADWQYIQNALKTPAEKKAEKTQDTIRLIGLSALCSLIGIPGLIISLRWASKHAILTPFYKKRSK